MASFTNTFTVAGLDIDGITHMQEAIKEYTDKIKKAAEAFNSTENASLGTSISNAIKGTATEAKVKTYVTGITTRCNNIIADLDNFYNALNTLKAKYETNDTSNASFTTTSAS